MTEENLLTLFTHFVILPSESPIGLYTGFHTLNALKKTPEIYQLAAVLPRLQG